MIAHDLLVGLSLNELSNLNLGMDGTGEIRVENKTRLLRYLHEVLTKLHNKFELKTTVYDLPIVVGQSSYAPSVADALKVQKIHSVLLEVDLPVNNSSSELGIIVNSLLQLELNTIPTVADTYKITYQTNHPVILLSNTLVEIVIPDVLLEAVTSYIAFKVYNAMNTLEAKATAKGYFDIYTGIVLEAVMSNSVMDSNIGSNLKFENAGWR